MNSITLAERSAIKAHIFKAYDIRGTTPTTINEGVAFAIGQAFGTMAMREGESTVAVGRDGKRCVTSPAGSTSAVPHAATSRPASVRADATEIC